MKLKLDPRADFALPLLLNLGTVLTVWMLARAAELWLGMDLVFGVTPLAFLIACESYIFTTAFTVREVDAPDALRWVEMGLMLLLAKVVAAGSLTGGWQSVNTWCGFALLAYAWFQGGRAARLGQYLHPGLLETGPGQERLVRDDHSRSFEAMREHLFGQIALVAAVLGIGAWIRGDVQFWGWSWLGFGLLVQTMLAAGTLLVGAQLKARITWAQEGLEADPKVFGRWAPIGLSLLLAPMLAALILPAGPRLPAEYLFHLFDETPQQEAPWPGIADAERNSPMIPPELWEEIGKGEPRWTWNVPAWVWYVLGAIPVLWLLRAAARQLAERVGDRELHGILAVLAALAAWYLTLWKAIAEMLGGVIRQAVATPAEAVGALFSEAGAVGRFLPFGARAPGDPRSALRFYFARLQTEAGRRGHRRAPAVTAAEFGRRLAEAAPERTGEIAGLTEAYQEARYSDLPIPPEKASFAKRAWVSIARSIRRKDHK